jgi:formylglycine-generating enzyme required for sulfatase activity
MIAILIAILPGRCLAQEASGQALGGAECIESERVDAEAQVPPCIKLGAGKTVWIRDCKNCPEMVLVPRGTVKINTMPPTDAIENQGGDTTVSIEEPFAVGRLAVTFAEWDACVDDSGCNGYVPPDLGWGRGTRPVISVNWDDAQAYIVWLSHKTGMAYRLLTGAEREYVARAGTTTAYWWGDTLTLDKANVDLPLRPNTQPSEVGDGTAKVRHQTMPADSFEPNPWGLYNVHGNVWEWTSDCVTDVVPVLAEEIADNEHAPLIPAMPDCNERVSRGGSWSDYAYLAKSGAFVGFSAGNRNYAQGFRVARSLR